MSALMIWDTSAGRAYTEVGKNEMFPLAIEKHVMEVLNPLQGDIHFAQLHMFCDTRELVTYY